MKFLLRSFAALSLLSIATDARLRGATHLSEFDTLNESMKSTKSSSDKESSNDSKESSSFPAIDPPNDTCPGPSPVELFNFNNLITVVESERAGVDNPNVSVLGYYVTPAGD